MSIGWGQFDIIPPEIVNFELIDEVIDITDSFGTIDFSGSHSVE